MTEIAIALACLGVAAVAAFGLQRRTWRRIAAELYKKNVAIWANEPKWVACEPAEAVQSGYGDRPVAILRELKGLGFSYLGVLEDRANAAPIGDDRWWILSVFVGDGGTVWAASYRAFDHDVVEFETEFANGYIVDTGNNAGAGLMSSPPGHDVTQMAYDTPIPDLLVSHRARVQARLASDSQHEVLPCHSLQDVLVSQQRQLHHKRAYRLAVGYLTEQEWERVAQAAGLSARARRTIFQEYARCVREARG